MCPLAFQHCCPCETALVCCFGIASDFCSSDVASIRKEWIPRFYFFKRSLGAQTCSRGANLGKWKHRPRKNRHESSYVGQPTSLVSPFSDFDKGSRGWLCPSQDQEECHYFLRPGAAEAISLPSPFWPWYMSSSSLSLSPHYDGALAARRRANGSREPRCSSIAMPPRTPTPRADVEDEILGLRRR
jgi:hypothetical protein